MDQGLPPFEWYFTRVREQRIIEERIVAGQDVDTEWLYASLFSEASIDEARKYIGYRRDQIRRAEWNAVEEAAEKRAEEAAAAAGASSSSSGGIDPEVFGEARSSSVG